jgi:hypothetical protein
MKLGNVPRTFKFSRQLLREIARLIQDKLLAAITEHLYAVEATNLELQ